MNLFDPFLQSIHNHLDEDVREIGYFFGASPLRPKEVYTIILPMGFPEKTSTTTDSERASRKAMLALFRSMTGCDQLFQTFSKTLIKTNLFVALKKSQNGVSSDLVERPELYFSPKCKRTVIRL